MSGRCHGARCVNARRENEQLYKVDLPEVDIPSEVLVALLEIRELQGDYDAEARPN